MTDEKKKPEEDEVSDEQLEDVAGGINVLGTKSTDDFSQEMAGAKPGEVRGFENPDGSTSFDFKSDGPEIVIKRRLPSP